MWSKYAFYDKFPVTIMMSLSAKLERDAQLHIISIMQ